MLSALFRVTLIRRCITFPVVLTAWAGASLAAPVVVATLLVSDLIRRNRQAWTRAYLMLLVYLTCEAAGIIAGGWLWATRGRDRAAFLDRNFRLQCWWAATQFRAGVWLYGLLLEVRGEECVSSGPMILLVRHVSVFDNLIPAVFLSERHGIRLRWVLNRSLLRDPCLDLVGNRLPNCFVQGGTTDSEREIAKVAALGENLGPLDGVVIYPEGSLFSPARRERIVESLRSRGATEEAQRAEAYRNVLPPRPGGTLALLRAAPGADVVICTHSGLERAATRTGILHGSLIGATLRIEFERFPRTAIPVDEPEREQWLCDRWSDLDTRVAQMALLSD